MREVFRAGVEAVPLKSTASFSLSAQSDGTEAYPSMHRGRAHRDRRTLRFVLMDELVTAVRLTAGGNSSERSRKWSWNTSCWGSQVPGPHYKLHTNVVWAVVCITFMHFSILYLYKKTSKTIWERCQYHLNKTNLQKLPSFLSLIYSGFVLSEIIKVSGTFLFCLLLLDE